MSFHLPTVPTRDVPSESEDIGSISAPPHDHSERAGQKRKRYLTVTENGKKRKVIDINSFHPDLQSAIDDLKQEISKGKFRRYVVQPAV